MLIKICKRLAIKNLNKKLPLKEDLNGKTIKFSWVK